MSRHVTRHAADTREDCIAPCLSRVFARDNLVFDNCDVLIVDKLHQHRAGECEWQAVRRTRCDPTRLGLDCQQHEFVSGREVEAGTYHVESIVNGLASRIKRAHRIVSPQPQRRR